MLLVVTHAYPTRRSSGLCQVVGLDLTEVYCQTAQELSQRVRLEEQTRFLCADALHLPFSAAAFDRSEEHTSELQSLMRISYAVFCLKKKKNNTHVTI